jgi:hypothetical protein
MSAALNVYDAFAALKQSDNWADFLAKNPAVARIVNSVNELRREHE